MEVYGEAIWQPSKKYGIAVAAMSRKIHNLVAL
jgi:hypothetical protein